MILGSLPPPTANGPAAWVVARDTARAAFRRLNDAFIRQAAGGAAPAAADRVWCAWALTGGAIGMLRELAAADPAVLRPLDVGA